MKSDEEITREADKARTTISKGESAIWAENTPYTAEELEVAYETHIVTALEADKEPRDFEAWCLEYIKENVL